MNRSATGLISTWTIMRTEEQAMEKHSGKNRIDLTGQRFGLLTVIELSDQYGTRGKRKLRLWKCQCDCGEIIYKHADSLKNGKRHSCKNCAGTFLAENARSCAGYIQGTQLSRLRSSKPRSDNISGVRGVVWDKKLRKWRARLIFKGTNYSFGSYTRQEDAIAARQKAEEKYYAPMLSLGQSLQSKTESSADEAPTTKIKETGEDNYETVERRKEPV